MYHASLMLRKTRRLHLFKLTEMSENNENIAFCVDNIDETC